VVTASCVGEALRHTHKYPPDLILADMCLPDGSGIGILQHLRRHGALTPFIIITGFATVRSAVEAIKVGTLEYLEKPVFAEELLRSVRSGLCSFPDRSGLSQGPHPHAALRWSALVVGVLDSEVDPTNVQAWAALANTLRATIENRCLSARVGVKPSLDFARVLRALTLGSALSCSPADFLDCDPRTLLKLAHTARTDLLSVPVGSPDCTLRYLTSQQFVVSQQLLSVVRANLSKRESNPKDHLSW
jgi:ActR/RegA family two-component response regulator